MPSKSSALPKVPGTIQRGGRYHVNIKIPEPLRDRYGGKDIYRESTGTSDPSQASRRVIEVRAMLSLEKESAAKAADLDRLVSALRPDDQEIFKAAGGLKGLIRRFDDRRVAAAFIEVAKPSRDPHDDSDDRSDEMVQADLAGHYASADVMRGHLNRDGKILRQLN